MVSANVEGVGLGLGNEALIMLLLLMVMRIVQHSLHRVHVIAACSHVLKVKINVQR